MRLNNRFSRYIVNTFYETSFMKSYEKLLQNEKNWATGQSCIHKEGTSYKIHTLITSFFLLMACCFFEQFEFTS